MTLTNNRSVISCLSAIAWLMLTLLPITSHGVSKYSQPGNQELKAIKYFSNVESMPDRAFVPITKLKYAPKRVCTM